MSLQHRAGILLLLGLPIGAWLGLGLTHITTETLAVADGLGTAQRLDPGLHFVPPGIKSVRRYPSSSQQIDCSHNGHGLRPMYRSYD